MKNLLEIKSPNSTSETAAARMETPLSIRVNTDDRHQITLSASKIIAHGSDEDYGLEAFFAFKLKQDCSEAGNSIDRISAIRSGNLGNSLFTLSNIEAIKALLPKNSEGNRILGLAFQNGFPEADSNDFSYFHEGHDFEMTAITHGMITLACIYKYLQVIHHINPDDLLKSKLDYILEEYNS